MTKIKLDNKEYDISNPSEAVSTQLNNIKFVNDIILQKNNEMQIAQTAKIGYTRALNRELEKIKINE